MQTIIKYAVIVLAVNLLVACAANAKKNLSESTPNTSVAVADCVFPNSEKPAPDWICDVPVPGIGLQAVGVAEESKAGMGFMRDQARLNALGNMVEQYKTNVSKMVKSYLGSTGKDKQGKDKKSIDKIASSTSRSVSSETLSGAKTYRSRTGPDGRLYMLLGISSAEYKALDKETIKTSMNNNKALWQELKAQKSFEEMDAEIAKMNESR